MQRTRVRPRFHLTGVVAWSLIILLSTIGSAEATRITARRLLPKLSVRSERNVGYDRARFADWLDRNGDGCDTRAEVLIAENSGALRKDRYCTVLSGRWRSVFDGRVWRRASHVDIDHLVALAEAWGSGARNWSATRRVRFANDLGYRWSLNAMTDDLNSSKSDRDPSEWLPPQRRCRYGARWMAVKYRWRLSIDRSERSALSRLLSGRCGSTLVRLPQRATGRTMSEAGRIVASAVS